MLPHWFSDESKMILEKGEDGGLSLKKSMQTTKVNDMSQLEDHLSLLFVIWIDARIIINK